MKYFNRTLRPLVFLALGFLLALPLSVFVDNRVNAAIATRPSGMIVRDDNGSYYYTYYSPGTDYSDPRLRYIGQTEVLNYYLERGRKAYSISQTEKAQYTIHNHNLTLPCGEAVRDADGRIAFLEPLGWPPGQQDQADPVFSYSENFAYYVPYVNWDYPNPSGGHHQDILKESGYNQLPAISSLIQDSIYPFGVPNCVIVKQSGTPDYYRVFRHRHPDAIEIERKMRITTPEVLRLWTNFNSYTYETDITSLPNVGDATLPPGLLVRTVANPMVYFTDDEGYKVEIPTMAKFTELGFSVNDVKFVTQATLDLADTRSIYPAD